MAKPSLDGVDLKLARADEHLRLLRVEATGHIGSNHPGQVGHYDPDTGEYIVRLDCDPPPDEWGIRVSEIAHHLRSALDNLVWQLVLVRGGTPKDKVTAFPIEEQESRFKAAENRGVIAGIDPNDVAVIEQAQPYHHGPHWHVRHRLYMLKELNNVDKHRFLHIGVVALTLATPGGTPLPLTEALSTLLKHLPPDGDTPGLRGLAMAVPVGDVASVDEWTFSTPQARDHPTEIARVKVTPSGSNPQVKMHPDPTFDISVTNVEPAVTLADLERIQSRVVGMIDNFRPLF